MCSRRRRRRRRKVDARRCAAERSGAARAAGSGQWAAARHSSRMEARHVLDSPRWSEQLEHELVEHQLAAARAHGEAARARGERRRGAWPLWSLGECTGSTTCRVGPRRTDRKACIKCWICERLGDGGSCLAVGFRSRPSAGSRGGAALQPDRRDANRGGRLLALAGARRYATHGGSTRWAPSSERRGRRLSVTRPLLHNRESDLCNYNAQNLIVSPPKPA